MKPLHAAALALGVMLSSCGYVERGPTAKEVNISKNEYEECMRTTDYPSECAYEKHVRDFFFTYHIASNFEVSCQPGARTRPN